jgi:hypothetical protein
VGWAGPITAETARRLAGAARVHRSSTGPDGLPLDTGREHRTGTVGIRRDRRHRDPGTTTWRTFRPDGSRIEARPPPSRR